MATSVTRTFIIAMSLALAFHASDGWCGSLKALKPDCVTVTALPVLVDVAPGTCVDLYVPAGTGVLLTEESQFSTSVIQGKKDYRRFSNISDTEGYVQTVGGVGGCPKGYRC